MEWKSLKIFKILINIFAVFSCTSALPFHHNHCRTDADCLQSNFYCYESRECVECTKCSFYNRQPNSLTFKCAKNKDQCGECVSGMEPEYNFDGSFTCKLISFTTITTNLNTNNEISEQNSYVGLYIAIAIISVLALITLAFLIKYRKSFKRYLPNNLSNCPVDNNNIPTYAPPPYTEVKPSAPPEHDPLIPRRVILDDCSQRAIPSHNPYYVNGGTLGNNTLNTPDNPETIPEEDPESEEPMMMDEENTQPSFWAANPENQNPNPNSGDVSNQPVSFSGILSATNASQANEESFGQSNSNSSQNSNSENTNLPNQFNIIVQNNQIFKINNN